MRRRPQSGGARAPPHFAPPLHSEGAIEVAGKGARGAEGHVAGCVAGQPRLHRVQRAQGALWVLAADGELKVASKLARGHIVGGDRGGFGE